MCIELKTQVTSDIFLAGKIVREGGTVIFPTETVWGLGANAYDLKAVQKIYAIKNRPHDNPLIIHVPDIESLNLLGKADEHIDALNKLMPGPLSVVLHKRECLNGKGIYTANLPSLALRVPGNIWALDFLKAAQVPVAAPSVNISGRPSLTRVGDIIEQYVGKVNAILIPPEKEIVQEKNIFEEIGIESTIISLMDRDAKILRPGYYSYEVLKNFFPNLMNTTHQESGLPISPGMKYRHYAPKCEVILCNRLPLILKATEGSLGFSKPEGGGFIEIVADNVQYMRKLYPFLIDADKKKLMRVYMQTPAQDQFYSALINRLEKAASKV